jgi:anti-anti-sigma regulatory factor
MTSTRSPFAVDRTGTYWLIHVFGELQSAAAARLDRLLTCAALEAANVRVLFGECTYADSACVPVLAKHYTLLGSRLRIIVPPSSLVHGFLDGAFTPQASPVCETLRSLTDALCEPFV